MHAYKQEHTMITPQCTFHPFQQRTYATIHGVNTHNNTHNKQVPWLSADTLALFSHTECREMRTWEQLANDVAGRHLFSTGSLGGGYGPAFHMWACWKQHPCLWRVAHTEGDSMCFVYHEIDKAWIAWGLRSSLGLGSCRA
jgi:hypothetical protein